MLSNLNRSLLALLVLFCVPVSGRADIVGGEEVAPSDPIQDSTAALYSPSPDGRGGALCTASLIGKDVALTAAHCIEKGGPRPVLLFGPDVRSGAVRRPVTGEVVNPKWPSHAGRGMDEGDIALVRFGGGVPEGYRPVPMAASKDDFKRGASITVAGYGISDARGKSGAGVLRKTQVKVANPRSGKSEVVFDQSRGHGACHGDSGGPAFARENGQVVVAGVTNRSHPARAADDCAHGVVYTKVAAYRPWIERGEKELHSRTGGGAQLERKTHARTTLLKKRVAHVGASDRARPARAKKVVRRTKTKRPERKHRSGRRRIGKRAQ